MCLGACILPYEFLTQQLGFLQQFSNECHLLLHIMLQLTIREEYDMLKWGMKLYTYIHMTWTIRCIRMRHIFTLRLH